MGPLATTAIFPVSTLVLSAFTVLAQRLSKRLGRVTTVILGRALGTLCLVAMALLQAQWHRVYLMCGIYVVRTAANNAQYPLLKSVLMDYVSKAARGKVNSLESISQFGWSGSAIVGGVLLDKYDYATVFWVTVGHCTAPCHPTHTTLPPRCATLPQHCDRACADSPHPHPHPHPPAPRIARRPCSFARGAACFCCAVQ